MKCASARSIVRASSPSAIRISPAQNNINGGCRARRLKSTVHRRKLRRMQKNTPFIFAALTALSALGLALAVQAAPVAPADPLRAVNKFFLAAGAAEEKGDFDAPIQPYDELLAISPDDEPVLLDRGSAYASKKDFDAAMA